MRHSPPGRTLLLVVRVLTFLIVGSPSGQPRPPLSEAPDNPLGLSGFVVELPEGVEELVHLSLDSGVAGLGGGPGPLRLLNPGLDRLVPAALLRQVDLQTQQLALQLLVPLLQAGRDTHGHTRGG